MNYSLKISQDRNGAIPKTEKICVGNHRLVMNRAKMDCQAVSIIPGTDDPTGAVARTPRNRMTTPNER